MVHSDDCIFCKIISGSIPAVRVFENDSFICIRDIQPHAKIHLLVIPKRHIASLDTAFSEGTPGEREIIGEMYGVGVRIARAEGLLPGGFRAVINTNAHGGQTVYHLHLHLIGGEALTGRMA